MNVEYVLLLPSFCLLKIESGSAVFCDWMVVRHEIICCYYCAVTENYCCGNIEGRPKVSAAGMTNGMVFCSNVIGSWLCCCNLIGRFIETWSLKRPGEVAMYFCFLSCHDALTVLLLRRYNNESIPTSNNNHFSKIVRSCYIKSG